MASEKIINLKATDFSAEVLNSDIPVMVDFWAPWCGPCRMVSPVMEQLAADYEGKAKICKVNVDDEGQLAAQFGVMSIPAIFVFSGGKVVAQATGAYPKSHFAQMLDEVIK